MFVVQIVERVDYLNLDIIENFCRKDQEGFGLVAFLMVVRAVPMVMKD